MKTTINEQMALEEAERQRVQWVVGMEESGEWADAGGMVRSIREGLGLSIARVAGRIGVSESTLSRFERGKPVQAARIIESAAKLYLTLKAKETGGGVAIVDEEVAPYVLQVIKGHAVISCNETRHEHVVIKPIVPYRIADALKDAISVANTLGLTPICMEKEVENLLSLPELHEIPYYHFVVKENDEEVMSAVYGSELVTFASLSDLRDHAIDQLRRNGALYTRTAFVQLLKTGDVQVTFWGDETFPAGFAPDVANIEFALNAGGLKVPFRVQLERNLLAQLTKEDADALETGECTVEELRHALAARFVQSLQAEPEPRRDNVIDMFAGRR